MREKSFRGLTFFIVLSLFIHGVILFGKLFNFTNSDYTNKPEQRIVLKLNFNKNIDSKKIVKQIVQNEFNENHKKPDESKFLSRKNQFYLKQTVARNIGKFKKSNISKKINSLKQKYKTKQNEKRIKLSDLGMKPLLEKKNYAKDDRKKIQNPFYIEKAYLNASSNNDYVEDIPLGDFTHLNTVEYKYYGFYHRIRQKLEQHWGNSLRKKAGSIFKQGRRVPASKERITSLSVFIDKNGSIVSVIIKGTSGVKELDDAAVESFNKAGPFPNPPKGLIKNGIARIEWGFVVKS